MSKLRMTLPFVALALVACRNDLPEAFITSHVEGDVLTQGWVETFTGRVTDDRTDFEALEAQWFLAGSEVCTRQHPTAEDIVECEVLIDLDAGTLAEGQVELALEAADEDGSLGAVTLPLGVRVSDAPVVEIVAPEPDAIAYTDTPLALYGIVSDELDDPTELVVWWSSDVDGDLALDSFADDKGDVIGEVEGLSTGPHVLTLSAQDTTGAIGSASVSFGVFAANTEPSCAITAPPDGTAYDFGTAVLFTAEISDFEDGFEGIDVTWSSDLDGVLETQKSDEVGTAELDIDDLSLGSHTITLGVLDSGGLACEDSILYTVGSPPILVIDEPLADTVYNDGDTIRFQATVTSETTLVEDLAFTWSSDVNGLFSTEGASSAGIASFETSELSVGAHTVTVQAVDDDGFVGQDTVALVINGLPEAPTLEITPDPATTVDELLVTIVGEAVDPEGDAVTYTYSWAVDGVVSSASTSDRLPSSVTDRDETWEVTITPNDGLGDGEAGVASIVISNTPPVLASVDLSPTEPVEGDTLTCTPGTTTDVDGDTTLTYSYAWDVDGTTLSETGDTLADTSWSRGESVTCTVTPSDGTDDGVPVASNTVTADNTAPQVSTVSISPDPAQAADTLTCTYTGYADADGDADASTYAWTVDGTTVGTSSTLAGAFVGGETVACTVTPDDGTDTGTPVSDDLVVTNTAPSIGVVSITPDPAYAGDAMLCSYTGFSDDDGDADQSTFSWRLDGSPAGTSSVYEGTFIRDQVLTCTVTPNDGEDAGTAVVANLTVTNSAPSVASVSISPASPAAEDTLTCSYSGYSDADGDADQSTYAWSVNSVAVGTGDTLASGFTGTDLVECTVTPDDGTDAGTPVTASATIGNTAPAIATVAISPSSAVVGDTLTCSYAGYVDPDGDPDASTYLWTINGSSAGTTDTLSSGFVGGDDVVCTVTPYDGFSTGTALSDSLTVDNTAPSITSVAISPTSASTGDTLTCTYSGYSDADGDADQSTTLWTVGGIPAGTDSTLTGGFSGGDTVACFVTPDDGEDPGTAIGDSLTVDNSAPSITSVTIDPSSAGAEDTLTCSYTGYSDDDGDADQSTYEWTVDGSVEGTGSTLSGAFIGGQSVVCTVTPSDGNDDGTPLSDSLTIDNTAPSISSVTITPADGTTSDTLTCNYSGFSDPDGDSDESDILWHINGSTVSTATTLSSGYVGGDTVSCTVTPSDGSDDGTALSDSLTVVNSLPSVSSVSISPSAPTVSDTLTCSYSGFSDADGESDQSTYAWTISGTTVGTTDTLATGSFTGGDTITCTVTPNDGNEDGVAVSDSVSIDNTAPSITSVSISPSTAQAADTLTCSYSGYSDPDGDADQSTYSWTVGGTEVGAADTLSGAFVGTDVVTCTVTPSDGSAEGTALSDAITIDNTVPSITGVAISPSPAQVADTLTCAYTGYSDDDGDTDASTYAWTINGSTASETSDTLSSGYVGGDTVVCTVTPNDGTADGTALSDSLTLDNTEPSISSVTISPSAADVGDTLTCSYSGFSDPDSDSDASTYEWTVNGTTAGTTDTLSTGFAGGDTVTCTVTPDDGEDPGTALSDSLTIGNTAPEISSVAISPSTVVAGDTLTCTYSGYSDADGDADVSLYLWTINGSTAGTTDTLTGGFVGADIIACTVTPYDGTDQGTSVTDSLVVDNTAPELDTVTISPSTAQAGDTLTCSHSGYSDADGDADVSTYEWTINGTSVSTDTSLSSGFVGTDTVTCTVTPDDGTDTGTAVSDSLTVDNTAPEITSVSITPTSPAVTDDLVCSYTGYSDVDGDADQSTYDWTVNGTSVGSADTLAAGDFASGDTVSCTVTPSDGTDDGSAITATLTVGNSPPSITSVTIDPSAAQAGDTLTCTYSGYSDADGDPDQSTYRWTINGSTAGTSDTLFAGFVGSDTVACNVTPDDGSSTGTVVSDSIVIDNTAPSVSSVAITPASPVSGDTLTCAYTGYSDVDGDADQSTYAWTLNGTAVGTGDTLSTTLVGTDVVTCTVTPSDGSDSGTDVSDSVTVDNTAPSITSVSISPSSAAVGDTLTCSYSGYSDVDGDADQSTYSWTVGGTEVGTSDTLSSDFVGGDSITCTVTPYDGIDSGTTDSASLTIDNTAPVLADATLSPDPAYEADTLTCTEGTGTDADGDSITYSYAWTVDGTGTGTTSSTLANTFWDKGETVVCTVTPNDGSEDGAAVDANAVTIANTAPELTSVTVTPASPQASDTLTCTPTSSDDDSDTVTYSYSWTISGTQVSTSSTLSGAFVGGDTVTCTVTPNDGEDDGATDSDAVTVGNTAPTISSVSISPTTAYVDDTLTCTYSGFSDDDGDADQSTYSWTVSGTEVGTSETLSGAFAAGDTVTCTVTPYDGADTGTSDSASIAIDNTAPVLADATLSPDPAYEGDTLTCSEGTTTDADGDTVTYSYAWSVDGTGTGTTASTLSDAFWDRDQEVICTVTPNDGTEDGASVDSNAVTITNTAPAITGVTVTPASAGAEDTLTCTPAGPSDADGDSVSYTYSWSISGTEVGTTDSLSGAFVGGDTVTCTVTPTDGTDDGATDSDSVTIGNSAPSISSVSISPSSASVGDTLTCSYTGYSDPDGDADQSTYSWTVNGSVAGASDTLSGAFVGGDDVVCTVTPSDGTDDGTDVSDSLTIDNTLPVLADVTLSPDPAYEGDTLTCTEGSASDDDGDTVTFTYSWTVDGVDTGTTGSTLGDTFWAKGEAVVCRVTPSDGTGDGTPVDSNTVTITNTAPVLSNVVISPSSAATGDTLTCTPASDDADGDTVTYSYSWTVSGTEIGTSSTVSSDFVGGDTVTCTVTPNDGEEDGSTASDSITIDNTAPSISSVSISPTTPTDADDLTCSYSGFSDADGDADQSTYSWTISGTEVGTSATLTSSNFSAGDVVTCAVTPFDGSDTGTVVNQNVTITSSNSAPTIDSITFSPTTVYADDDLTVSVSTTDADGDTVTLSYSWTVNTSVVSTSSTLTGGTDFVAGDTIYVDVTADDGVNTPVSDTSSTITVQNSAPTTPAVSLDSTSDLVCSIDLQSSDIDGDTITYTFEWDADGSIYPDDFGSATGPTTTTRTDDTIPSADLSLAGTFTCLVTANDGTDDSGTAEASETFGLGSTTLALGDDTDGGTDSAYSDGFESAFLVTASNDATIDGLGAWFGSSGGSVILGLYDDGGSGPGDLLAYTDFETPAAGQNEFPVVTPVDITAGNYYLMWITSGNTTLRVNASVSVDVYFYASALSSPPSDPFATTTNSASSDPSIYAVSVSGSSNTAPSVTSVSVTPTTPSEGDTLTCSYSGYSDADGDPDQSEYQWDDGTYVIGHEATQTGGFVDGDVVTCTVLPFDGIDYGDPVSASVDVSLP